VYIAHSDKIAQFVPRLPLLSGFPLSGRAGGLQQRNSTDDNIADTRRSFALIAAYLLLSLLPPSVTKPTY